jgi:hypothetical protein
MKINNALLTTVLLTIVSWNTGCSDQVVTITPPKLHVVIDSPSWGKEFLEDYEIKAVGETNGTNPIWLLDGKIIGTGIEFSGYAGDETFTIGKHTLEFAATLNGEAYSHDIPITIYKLTKRTVEVVVQHNDISTHVDTVTGTAFEINGVDKTVTTLALGRMYLKDNGIEYTFSTARKHIKQLNKTRHLGYNNWRLASAKEMGILFKVHTVKDEVLYYPVDLETVDARMDGVYWSSTRAADGLDGVMRAHVFQLFKGDSVNVIFKVKRKPSLLNRPRYVIPVRTLEI